MMCLASIAHFVQNKSPIPNPQAVDHALDIARLVLGLVAGVVCGIIVAFILSRISRLLARRVQILKALYRRIHTSMYVTLIMWGAYAGWRVSLFGVTTTDETPWLKIFDHFLLILAILMTTWMLSSAVWLVEDAANIRRKADSGKSRRFETQAQVLRRVGQALVWIVGITVVLATFPQAQKALGTVLASAGIASVIAGLAAQSTLGNFFAGMQLAFTDAIRVGDLVVINERQGTVEEITLTYVVLKIWDERRVIVPSSVLTTKPFENWTRQATRQLGTVEFYTDWAAPMSLIRAKVEQLLLGTDLWDGRSWSVQITNSTDDTVTIRLVVSAADAGKLWDLRCYLREKVIKWITTEQPWARPAHSYRRREAVTPEHDPAPEMIAQLASELSDITDSPGVSQPVTQGDLLVGNVEPPAIDEELFGSDDPVHAVRVAAARRKAKRARRKALTMKADDDDVSPSTGAIPDSDGRGQINEDPRSGDFSSAARNKAIKRISVFPPSSSPDSQVTRTHTFTPDEINALMARSRKARRLSGQQMRNEESADAAGGNVSTGKNEAQLNQDQQSRTPLEGEARLATNDEPDQRCGRMDRDGGSSSGTEPLQHSSVAYERLYSGSPEADEHGKMFAGPGEAALRERQAAVSKSDPDDEGLLDSDVDLPPETDSLRNRTTHGWQG